MVRLTPASSGVHYCKRLAAVIGILLSLHRPASAEDYFDLPPEDLLNFNVTSVSRKEQRLSEVAAAIYVISRDDILRSGVTTIPDALRMAPGVNVAQVDGNSWAISIRGFNSPIANKLLVMIDGRTVYNPAFAGTFWEIQDLVLADIERIEIIRGPGGTLWGANAVNGVINVITRDAADTQGTYISAVSGNVERGLIEARHGGALGNGGHYRAFAKAFDRDSFETPAGADAHDGSRSLRGGFRADWSDLTLQGDIYNTDADQRDFIPDFNPPFFGADMDSALKYQGGDLLARWKTETAAGGLLTVQSYADYTSRIWQQRIDDRRLTLDLDMQYNAPRRGAHALTTGANYRFMSANESITRNFSIIPQQENDSLVGLFVQDEITLVPETWFLTLGSKAEYNDFTGIEIEPNARLAWTPDGQQTAWLAISRAVRIPTLIEHHATAVLQNGAGTQTALVPNAGFDSEELVAYELGYRRELTQDASIDLAAFYNDYSELAAAVAQPPMVINNGVDPPFVQIPVAFANAMEGHTCGFEAAANWKVNPQWTLAGSYSYLAMFLHAAGGTLPDQDAAEDRSPRHQLSLRSNWRISDDWTLNTAAYHVSRLKTGDVDAYTRVDMNLGYRVSDSLQLNLTGQNLLQDDHREFGDVVFFNAADVPRSIFGRITWHY